MVMNPLTRRAEPAPMMPLARLTRTTLPPAMAALRYGLEVGGPSMGASSLLGPSTHGLASRQRGAANCWEKPTPGGKAYVMMDQPEIKEVAMQHVISHEASA